MVAQAGVPARQQHVFARATIDQPDQHGGRGQRVAALGQELDDVGVVPALPLRRGGWRMQGAGKPGGGGDRTQARFASRNGSTLLHQVQALVVVHLRPARDLAGAAVAAFAQALLVQGADAHAGTEHGTVSRVHARDVTPRRRWRRGAVRLTWR
jgi:hypothetical protein